MTTTAARLERAFTGLTDHQEMERVKAFVLKWSEDKSATTGSQIAAKVNMLLGSAVVQFVSADDTEGGHHD